VLRLENIAKSYQSRRGTVRAIVDFSVTVDAGQFVAVQGPSGCGKTTLLLIAGGMLRPDQGQVWVDQTNLYQLTPGRRSSLRAAKIGFVFQQFHLIPYLSVLHNVLAPSMATGIPEARKHAMELLERFGLADRAAHFPGQLSTGERQRAALARALLSKPRLLLADEPTGNLDQKNGAAVLGCLAAFASAGGAVLLVTHDPRAAQYAGRVVRLAPAPSFPGILAVG